MCLPGVWFFHFFIIVFCFKAMGRKLNSSWSEWKYPEWMDVQFRDGRWWVEQKKKDDGAEGLWRIHDGLYDLSSWVDKHPGGKTWITLTRVSFHLTASFNLFVV